MKFYRGSAGAARTYVEADRSRADDYYLAEGSGLAEQLLSEAVAGSGVVTAGRTLDGDGYEKWVAGYQADGTAKGRLRHDDQALRFVEVVINGPMSWSLAAAVHPAIADAYDTAQDDAARQIVAWITEHATTRVGPRGRQVQVPVDKLEAAVVRHYTSRAGDPHRHLHLQINARVFAAGRWRGLHSVGVVDSIEAINGIGHAAVATHPVFREALAAHGYTLDPHTAEVVELAPFVPAFSARAAQIARNVDKFEAQWRTVNPNEEPGPALRRSWDRRAWATARPDKVIPTDGTQITRSWLVDLSDAGFAPPTPHADTGTPATPGGSPAQIDPRLVADLVLLRLGGRRSSWNAADIRGEVERLLSTLGLAVDPEARQTVAADLTAHVVGQCVLLLDRNDVPQHVRNHTSPRVLGVEADIIDRLAARSARPGLSVPPTSPRFHHAHLDIKDGGNLSHSEAARGPEHRPELSPQQCTVAGALAGTHRLLVVEGAAGAGKTTTLAAAKALIEEDHRRLVVLTPTLKAAEVAGRELNADAFSAAWLVHQHGFRWDDDHRWTRVPTDPAWQDPRARVRPGDVLVVDEAGMLDQETAQALLTVADESHAQVALVGDRHQLPAVGRGGVLDLAARWAPSDARLELGTVHRFSDPDYAALTLLMRTGDEAGEVFDALLARGDIVIHPTDVERRHHLAAIATRDSTPGGPHAGDVLVLAPKNDQVRELNAAIRGVPRSTSPAGLGLLTAAGDTIAVGDQVATRRNDRELDVANRDRWVVTALHPSRGVTLAGDRGDRVIPLTYAVGHLELAYATSVHGAQGETVDEAHVVVDDTTSAAAAYVGMTRGRRHNTAHLVADDTLGARSQWVGVFARDRADLGPGHAAHLVATDVERFGTSVAPGRPATTRIPTSTTRGAPDPGMVPTTTPRRERPPTPSPSGRRPTHGGDRRP